MLYPSGALNSDNANVTTIRTNKNVDIKGYNPLALDDPNFAAGVDSDASDHEGITGFVNYLLHPSAMAADSAHRDLANRTWARHHPEAAAQGLSLTKLRGMKRRIMETVEQLDLDLSTAAIAFMYLENLIRRGAVTKHNRRAIAGVCLVLAAKINEPKEQELAMVIRTVAQDMEVSEAEIRARELAVYVALEFQVFCRVDDIQVHLQRALSMYGEEGTTKKAYFPPVAFV